MAGAVGSALFILLFLVSDLTKPDYSPLRDAVSEAQIGPGGWLQITNFIVSGLLMAASWRAISRRVSPWTGALVGVVGIGIALAGVFVTDPLPTDQLTWHGIIHTVFGSLSSLALIVACFIAARWRPTRAWRAYCIAVGVAMPLVFMISAASPDTFGLWQRVTNVLGWTWLIALQLRAAAVPTSSDEAPKPGLLPSR